LELWRGCSMTMSNPTESLNNQERKRRARTVTSHRGRTELS